MEQIPDDRRNVAERAMFSQQSSPKVFMGSDAFHPAGGHSFIAPTELPLNSLGLVVLCQGLSPKSPGFCRELVCGHQSVFRNGGLTPPGRHQSPLAHDFPHLPADSADICGIWTHVDKYFHDLLLPSRQGAGVIAPSPSGRDSMTPGHGIMKPQTNRSTQRASPFTGRRWRGRPRDGETTRSE